jgi:anti-anti-sigma factor
VVLDRSAGMADDEEASSTDLFRLVVVRDGADVTLFAVGHLDVDGGRRLRDRVEDLLTTRPASITMEASGVTFMDSSGLAALLGARHAVLTEAGVPFRVMDPSAALRRVVEMAGFDNILSKE